MRMLLLLSALATPALAHHGWSGFDTQAPIYLAGTVVKASWQNPHAMLVVEPDRKAALPADLAARRVPAQQAPVDAAGLLAKARLSKKNAAAWQVELAPLFRMEAWRIPELKTGDRVELVGYTSPGERGEAVMRVEFLFVGGSAYGLRSMPSQ